MGGNMEMASEAPSSSERPRNCNRAMANAAEAPAARQSAVVPAATSKGFSAARANDPPSPARAPPPPPPGVGRGPGRPRQRARQLRLRPERGEQLPEQRSEEEEQHRRALHRRVPSTRKNPRPNTSTQAKVATDSAEP